MNASLVAPPPPAAGADVGEWFTFAQALGLAADLLPVVSNSAAEISPRSKIKAGDKGKVPSVYNTSGAIAGIPKWAQHIATAEEVALWQQQPDYGICVQTRAVRALDVDVTDPALAQEVAAMVAAFAAGLPRRGRANSPKFLIPFRLAGDYTKRVIQTRAGRIEFLAGGQQFIAAGTHPSGARYTWSEAPYEIATRSAADFEALWAALTARFAVTAKGASTPAAAPWVDAARQIEYAATDTWFEPLSDDEKAAQVRAIVATWTAEQATNRDEWFKGIRSIADAVDRGLDHETGVDIAHQFSERSTGARDSRDAVEAKMFEGGSKPSMYAAATIARKVLGAAPPPPPAGVAPPPPTPAVAPRRLTIRSLDDVLKAPSLRWRVKGVLPAVGIGAIYGPYGTGKSFLLFDLLAKLATAGFGSQWFGHRIKPAAVLYIMLEGAGGLAQRAQAYTKKHGAPTGMQFLPDSLDLRNATDITALVEAIRAVQWPGDGVIAIDTLNAAMPGGDENGPVDMGLMIAAMKAIQREFGGLVLVVHHTGKDATKGMRGHTSLIGALDAALEVTRDGPARAWHAHKVKDGVDGGAFAFALETVHLGTDEDGDVLTSCVIEYLGAAPPKLSQPMGDNAKAAMAAVRELSPATPGGRVPSADALSNAVERIPKDPDLNKKDRRREHVKRAFENLLERGALSGTTDDWVSLPASRDPAVVFAKAFIPEPEVTSAALPIKPTPEALEAERKRHARLNPNVPEHLYK